MYLDDSLLPGLVVEQADVFLVVQLDEGEVLQTVVTHSPVPIFVDGRSFSPPSAGSQL